MPFVDLRRQFRFVHAHWAALAAVIIAGALLRLQNLNATGFNSDEAVYTGQGAAIAGDNLLTPLFPIFRAHPLLFQFAMAIIFPFFSTTSYDTVARILAVIAGLLTVIITYKIGTLLYNRNAGLVAAAIVALTPYHVIVSRQALLDGPMTLLASLTLYFIARYGVERQSEWLYAAGAAMGLTVLAKEPAIVLIAAIFGFFATSPEIGVRFKDLSIAAALMFLTLAFFPLALLLAGGGGQSTAEQYLSWQLFRRPNHDWTFYLIETPKAIGPLVFLLLIAGLLYFRKEIGWRERLLLSWMLTPIIFFQLWPVKGFQYLLPIVVPIAVLCGWVLTQIYSSANNRSLQRTGIALLMTILVFSLIIPSWIWTQPAAGEHLLAGSGGVPGGRETGEWIRDHTPAASTVMTIGPSMANIIQFYGHRRAYGISVSPNPLHRNPSYDPIDNPDFELRSGEFQYLIWDTYSASRSSFFSEKLLTYSRRYNGRVVHTETVLTSTANGSVETPVIVVYEVRP